jgi:hypothetical protein|tara:strand:+ start:1333 stop:1716 length:384 start_codon:yes stop_codon:yes gene_type:complete
MKYALFTKEGNLKTVWGDKAQLGLDDGNFIVEVEDDFEMMGYMTSYDFENKKIVQVEEDLSVLPGPEEIALQNLRNERNRLLVETDWTQLPDVPETTKNAWQTYRQELRDITKTYQSIDNVVWPTKP